jgi:hypothetical protein
VALHLSSNGALRPPERAHGGYAAAGVIERLLTSREVGELLGFSAATIQDWARRTSCPPSNWVAGSAFAYPKSRHDWSRIVKVP